LLRRRLHLQIYFAVVASLVLAMILTGLLWSGFGRDRLFAEISDITGILVSNALPPADAAHELQATKLEQLGKALDVDLALYDSDRRLIASHGKTIALPPRGAVRHDGWHRLGRGSRWLLVLADGRTLVADLDMRPERRPLVGLLLFLGSIALAVTIGAYPFVRRLTGRLERLQKGVERIGAGDLAARVRVEGRDEVASLAQSFNVAAAKIERLVGAHRLLLANASHELRTPLARIRLGIEMLRNGGGEERETALRADIAELESLIDEILLMSRLDMGPQIADRTQSVDLVALAAEECARYDNCEVTGAAPDIAGDEALLRRLIRNLLENALVHGKPPILVTVSQEPGHAVLMVSDGGPGISAADAEKVFQPFYRASGRQNVKGYGLGLPLVRQIAEAHGGSAMIVDRDGGVPGGGSAVRVRLAIGKP
jgi:two-component system, OmpR family, sensor histidine kinase RstB